MKIANSILLALLSIAIIGCETTQPVKFSSDVTPREEVVIVRSELSDRIHELNPYIDSYPPTITSKSQEIEIYNSRRQNLQDAADLKLA